MKRFQLFFIAIIPYILITQSEIFAHGISRSTGLGVRLGFWNITGQPSRISVDGGRGTATVDVSGAGAWLTFFSRTYNDLFFEMSLGAIAGVRTEQENFNESKVNVEAIMPFLLGLRYQILGTRLSGAFHPYLSLGGGPYWATSVTSSIKMTGPQELVSTGLEYGGYLGGGTFLVLASFFALNFDLKYHFIDFQPDKDYSGLEFGMGLNLMWGKKREAIQVLGTKLIVDNIYPAYYQFYSTYPLAFVTVKNLLGQSIDVNVRCNIKGFTERAKDSGFIRLKRGETKDIPVTVFFSRKFLELSRRKTVILDLQLEAKASTVYKQSLSAEIVLHSRNAWDGNIKTLNFFLTTEDEEILETSRKIVDEIPIEQLEEARNFYTARHIFEYLSDRGINYHPDPNIPFYQDDRVQFAAETLDIGSGDCDDLVVLYASLLESVGIKTAFVEVRDPQKEIAHLYLMFDTDLPASLGSVLTNNEKRYIVRENASGQSIIWIPVETTLIERGFEEAWNAAALAYLQEGVLRKGLAEDWVKIFDHHQ